MFYVGNALIWDEEEKYFRDFKGSGISFSTLLSGNSFNPFK